MMKLVMTLMLLALSLNSVAQTAPAAKAPSKAETKPAAAKTAKGSKPKKEGKMTLKATVDYNPKLVSFVVPDINKKNNFSFNIEIENTSVDDKMAKVVFYEYNPNENGLNDIKKSKANIKRPEFSITDYVKYSREAFLVKAKSKMNFKVDLELPKTLKGTKYAMYSVEEVPITNYVESVKAKRSKASSIAMTVSYLSPLVVDVANSGVKKVDLNAKYFPDEKLIVVDAKNLGDHYLRVPTVNLVLLNEKNEFVEKIKLEVFTDKIKNLHPTCHLPFIYRLPRGLTPGKYRAVMALSADEGLFNHSEEEDLVVEAPAVKETAKPSPKTSGKAPKKSK